MRLMYSLLIIIEIVLLGICAVKSINKKGKLAKIVLYYEAVAFIAGVFFWYSGIPGALPPLCPPPEGWRLRGCCASGTR